MDLNDYLLQTDSLDWAELLEPWEHLVPDELTVWFANRFGEPVFVFEDGAVHRLDLECEAVDRIAEGRDEFAAALDRPDNAESWLRVSAVDACVAAGLTLGPGQCYGCAVPILLGGEMSVANTRVWDVAAYFVFLADVYRQTRDLPDGAKVRLRFRDS